MRVPLSFWLEGPVQTFLDLYVFAYESHRRELRHQIERAMSHNCRPLHVHLEMDEFDLVDICIFAQNNNYRRMESDLFYFLEAFIAEEKRDDRFSNTFDLYMRRYSHRLSDKYGAHHRSTAPLVYKNCNHK